MKVIAHRGASLEAPENTLAAFQLAVEQGAYAIELDVHLSADGQLIVHHDYSLGNPDNGSGLIRNSNWEYIKTLDAGSWFAPVFALEPIPSLEQVFARWGNTIEYELEIKGTTIELLEKLLALVKKYNILNNIEFTSPHHAMLFQLQQMEPATKMGFFVQPYADWMSPELGESLIIDTMNLIKATVAHLPIAVITAELVGVLQHHHILVHAADCNSAHDVLLAKRIRCNQLSTNNVPMALKNLAEA